MMTPDPNPTPPAEPAYLPPLRVIGGIVGLLRAHLALASATPETIRHLTDRLEKEHAELWRLLVRPE